MQAFFVKHPAAIGAPLGALALGLLKFLLIRLLIEMGQENLIPREFILDLPYDSISIVSAATWGAILGGATAKMGLAWLRADFRTARDAAGGIGGHAAIVLGSYTALFYLAAVLVTGANAQFHLRFLIFSIFGNHPLQWALVLLALSQQHDTTLHQGVQITETRRL